MKRDYLWSYNFFVDHERVWFVPYWYNLLCCFNLNTKQLEIVEKIPEENNCEGLYINLVKIGDEIILIPNSTAKLCVYNVIQKEFLVIEILEKGRKSERFFSYDICEDNLYLFPTYYPAIVKLNIRSKKIEYIENWYHDSNLNKDEMIFRMQKDSVDHVTYLLFAGSNRIFKFDEKNEKYFIIEVGDKGDSYSTICKVQTGEIYLTNQDGDIVIFNENSRKTIKIKNAVKNFCKTRFLEKLVCFMSSVEYGDYVYFFPGQANKVIRINKHGHQIEEADFCNVLHDGGKKNLNWQGTMYSMIHKNKQYIYVMNILNRSFLKIDLNDKEVESFYISIEDLSQKYIDELFLSYGKEIGYIYWERDALYLRMKNFFDNMDKITKKSGSNPVIGKQIYDTVKQKSE